MRPSTRLIILLFLLFPSLAHGAADFSDLPYGLGAGHLSAIDHIKNDRYLDAIIALNGASDRPARLLKGVAYYARKEYVDAARELEAYTEGGVRGEEDRDLYIQAMRMLSDAYYRSDQLAKSQEVNKTIMTLRPDEATLDNTMQMYNKTHRELKGNETRLSESSEHFKVIYDGYEHGKVDRKVLAILEDAYGEIGREFDRFPRNSITVVLDTRSRFFDITRSPAWAGGVFMDGRIRVPVGGLEDFDDTEARRILRHEYVHALIYSITPQCPRWLHEGLAEYMTLGADAIDGKPRLPLNVIDSAFYSSDPRVAGTAYGQSLLSVKALIRQYSLYEVIQYLEAMAEGATPAAAFESVFMFRYDDFVQRLGEPVKYN